MNFKKYSEKFEKAAGQFDKKLLFKRNIEVAVGVILNAVYLKLYKNPWVNSGQDPLTAESRIFFSVWITDAAIEKQRIFYNIHALKLRKLKNYSIESRKFAEAFRSSFTSFKHKWKNVRVDYGPLTLMEGWVNVDTEDFQNEILELVDNFLEIEHLIDETLTKFKK